MLDLTKYAGKYPVCSNTVQQVCLVVESWALRNTNIRYSPYRSSGDELTKVPESIFLILVTTLKIVDSPVVALGLFYRQQPSTSPQKWLILRNMGDTYEMFKESPMIYTFPESYEYLQKEIVPLLEEAS